MDLSERKKKILKSIIDAYIDSGEPVGSKFLTTYGNISLSPATIRNEMSELEGLGYLDKPHTSAGRVPSALGYKFYVDSLSEDYRLSMEELELLNELTKFKTAQIDRLIDRANKIMSGVTKYAAISVAHHETDATVKRFDTVPVSDASFLLVLILPWGEAKTAQFASETSLTSDDLTHIRDLLNERIADVPLDKVPLEDVLALEEAFGRHKALVGRILRTAYSMTRGENGDEIRVDGLTNLLSYPEFGTADKARSIVELVESRRQDIKKLLETPADGEIPGLSPVPSEAESGMKIFIGENNDDPALADTSLVYCSFPVGTTQAVIGILGPRRMDYKKVVTSLKYLARGMTNNPENGSMLPDGKKAPEQAPKSEKAGNT